MIGFYVLLVVAQSHLTTLLTEGSLFNWFRKDKGLIGELFSCSLCMGFWTALFIAVFSHLGLFDGLAIAGLGHLITLARHKYLPCDGCTKATVGDFKITR